MKRGDMRDKTVDGQVRRLRYLGKGRFSVAWQNYLNLDIVYIWSTDLAKEAISVYCQPSSLPHVPFIEHLEDDGDQAVYKSVFYASPLRAKEKEAWEQYKVLRDAREIAWIRNMKYVHGASHTQTLINNGCHVMQDTLDSTRDKLPAALFESLESLYYAATTYGSSFTFEFAPTNLATDKSGNLVLLDIIFDTRVLVRRRSL